LVDKGCIFLVLLIVRRYPDFVDLTYDVMGEVHASVEHGCLDVDIQNVAEIEFSHLGADCAKEFSEIGIDTHTNFEIEVDGHRSPHDILDDQHANMPENGRDFLEVLRLIIDDENGCVAHGVEEFIEDVYILEKAIYEEGLVVNGGRGEKDYFSLLYGRQGLRKAAAGIRGPFGALIHAG
jgi:hypothetical protein